jgi:hypothetical protein
MAQEPKTYWVLGDGQGHVGTVIRNGVHLITATETPSKVKVARDRKTARHITRRQWDALPKVPCHGQTFAEALTALREVADAMPKTTRPVRVAFKQGGRK